MTTSFVKLEQIGRHALADDELEYLRKLFTLSHSRLAGHLHTNTRTLKMWLTDPQVATRVHSTTAARIGEFCVELVSMAAKYGSQGIHIANLYPLSLLAGQLGRSVESPAFTQLCRTNAITCYDMGILGTYIPSDQVEALRGKK